MFNTYNLKANKVTCDFTDAFISLILRLSWYCVRKIFTNGGPLAKIDIMQAEETALNSSAVFFEQRL